MRTLAGLLRGIGVAVLLIACRDRDPRTGDGTEAALRTATPPAPPVDRDPVPSSPATSLAEACLDGDPSLGESWRIVGLDSVSALTLTAIATITSRDSARLAARLARTVDALPNDTALADFRGLPVVIRAAWRIVVATDDTILIASAARHLPIESAPLEERLFVVTHPVVVPALREPLRVAWSAREVGREESLAQRDLVAAWTSADTISLLVARDTDTGTRAELLVRSTGGWQVASEGTLPACAPRR